MQVMNSEFNSANKPLNQSGVDIFERSVISTSVECEVKKSTKLGASLFKGASESASGYKYLSQSQSEVMFKAL